MNSKPLTYDSLKTVIQYLDPNTRFLLSSRAPSIRTAERAAPLRIGSLLIESHRIWVNNIGYECEVYHKGCKVKRSYRVSGLSRLNGKRTCNVDEFGTRDYIIKAGGMLPGNNGDFICSLFGSYDRQIIPTNEGRLQRLKEILEIEKQRLNQIMNYRPNENLMDRKDEYTSFYLFKIIGTDPPKLYTKKELEILKNEEMVKKAIKYVKDRIRQMENEINLFQNKSKNIRPKFEIYLVKYQRDCKPRVIEPVKYTGDLHKAEENLRDFMFSNRKHVIRVNLLKINQTCPVRMPHDLKMRVKNLNFKEKMSTALELVKPIIDESSFPLETLTIYVDHDDVQKSEYEFIRSSKLLFCHMGVYGNFRFILSLQNQKVNFVTLSTQFLRSDNFIVLIKSWVENNKPIGTCFTFSLSELKDEIADQILNKVKDIFVDATAGNKFIQIPMASAVLKIIYFRNASSHLFIRMAVVPDQQTSE
uniref:F-box domain-containing protein n=1 Tax=Caenorhabditis tropicalis TaxID=1561998 RepID=A0A1I7TAI4_9PELO